MAPLILRMATSFRRATVSMEMAEKMLSTTNSRLTTANTDMATRMVLMIFNPSSDSSNIIRSIGRVDGTNLRHRSSSRFRKAGRSAASVTFI